MNVSVRMCERSGAIGGSRSGLERNGGRGGINGGRAGVSAVFVRTTRMMCGGWRRDGNTVLRGVKHLHVLHNLKLRPILN